MDAPVPLPLFPPAPSNCFTSAFLSQLVLARFKDTVIQRLSSNHISFFLTCPFTTLSLAPMGIYSPVFFQPIISTRTLKIQQI